MSLALILSIASAVVVGVVVIGPGVGDEDCMGVI